MYLLYYVYASFSPTFIVKPRPEQRSRSIPSYIRSYLRADELCVINTAVLVQKAK